MQSLIIEFIVGKLMYGWLIFSNNTIELFLSQLELFILFYIFIFLQLHFFQSEMFCLSLIFNLNISNLKFIFDNELSPC